MKEFSGLLTGLLVLLLVLPSPAVAAISSEHAPVVPGPGLSAASVAPAGTTPAPLQPAVRYPVKVVTAVVTTVITQQAAGTLTVGSVPAGASVYIDGALKGTAPLTLRSIPAGVHAVSFTLAGYQDYNTQVTITAGAASKLAGVMTPVTPGSVITSRLVTSATSPPVPSTLVPVRRTTVPPATTVSVAVIRSLQPVPTGRCTRHWLGSGDLEMAPGGRLNCTTTISSDDGVTALAVQEGTLVKGAGDSAITGIRIVPVTPSEMPPAPEGSRWTGHASHFLPDHTSFDPPALVSFTLSRDEWDDRDPANLTIMGTSESGPGWEPLAMSVDPVTRTVSAPAYHFSIIGLFSSGPAAEPPAAQQSPADVIRTAAGSRHGPLPLSPIMPDAYAPLAAVGAGVALSIAGAMAAGSTAFSGLWTRIRGLIEKFLGSELSGLLNATDIEKRGIRPSENLSSVILGLSGREILVIGISALGFAAAFMLQDRLGLELITVLIYVCAGGVATILHDLAHRYGAWRTGCVTEYQFWGLGTATMLLTAWLFGNAFAKPSRTLVRNGKTISPEEAAIIRLAGPLTSMGVAVLSLFLIPMGGLFVIAGSAGFSMNLLNAVFSLVPVRPNDGVEVYAWNKLAWASVFVPLLAFYLYVYSFL